MTGVIGCQRKGGFLIIPARCSIWALSGLLRIATRSVSEEERRFLADASG